MVARAFGHNLVIILYFRAISGCSLTRLFISDLEITHEIDSQFYVSEVKDMVNIVQRLIADGKCSGVTFFGFCIKLSRSQNGQTQ